MRTMGNCPHGICWADDCADCKLFAGASRKKPPVNVIARAPRDVAELNAIDPPHYKSHPSGVECIAITEHMNFTLGNAVKYIWRASLKGRQVEDLKKARWYLDREIARLEPKRSLREKLEKAFAEATNK